MPQPLIAFRSSDDMTNYESHGLLEAALAVLRRPESWHDDEGYEHEVTAAAIDPNTGDVAWIERREKELEKDGRAWIDVTYTLRIQSSGAIVAEAEVETYNPFFGCYVTYFAWHGDQVVAIYREKHTTCVCAVGSQRPMDWLAIQDEWCVEGDTVSYDEAGVTRRLALPSLQALDP